MKKIPSPKFIPHELSQELAELLDSWKEKLEEMHPEHIILWATTHFHAKIALATSCHKSDVILKTIFDSIQSGVMVFDRMERFLLPETWNPLDPAETAGDTFDGTKTSPALWKRFQLESHCKKNEWKLQYYKIWVIASRRDQDERLNNLPVAAWNDRFGILRIAPFARWTEHHIEEGFKAIPEARFLLHETVRDMEAPSTILKTFEEP